MYRFLRRSVARVLATGVLQAWLGTLFATLFALCVMGHVDEALLLWPVSGIALALALPFWDKGWSRRIWLLAAASGGFWVGARLAGMPWWLASLLAAWTCIDVLIGTAILGPGVRTFEDLKDQKNIFRFLVAAVVAPLVTGCLGAYPVALFLKQSVFETGVMNIFGNSLGMAIAVPAVLLLKSRDLLSRHKLDRTAARSAGALLLLFVVCGLVFWQTTSPFLFMVFPPVILVVLVMGLEGAVLTSVTISFIGWIATVHHHGPIVLVRGPSLHHLLVLQSFDWFCLATALPVGALLDERRKAERSASKSQAIYKVLLHNAKDVIVLSSFDGTERYVSPAITRLAGWTEQEYLSLDRFETIHPDDQKTARMVVGGLSPQNPEATLRYRLAEKGGGWKWVQTTVCAYGIEEESIAGYVGTTRDISNIIRMEENWRQERRGLVEERHHLANLASTDPLTGLLNRRGFDERIQAEEGRADVNSTLLMIDIDFFKHYNDTYGHQAGDDCLVRVANVLRSHASRKGDLVARLGGEEFVVVLAEASPKEGIVLAETMCAALRALHIEHTSSKFGVVTISAGAAFQGGFRWNTADLLAKADSALYVSKRTRNCVSVYGEGMDDLRAS